MTTTRHVLLVFALLIAAVLGGGISHWLFTPQSASAQEAGHPRWVRGVTFYLVDEDDEKVLAAMALDDSGQPYFELRDRTEAARLKFRLTSGGHSSITVLNAQGNARASFGADEDGTLMKLLCANGSAGVQLSAGQTPGIALLDRSGRVRAELALDAAGDASLILTDADGTETFKAPSEE